MSRHELFGGTRDGGVIAKSSEPMNQGFLAEPGELPLGVAARRLRNGLRGGSERDSSFKMCTQFVISNEIERFGVERYPTANESGNFVQPAAIQHPIHALFDALIQCGSRRLQTNLDRGVPFQA